MSRRNSLICAYVIDYQIHADDDPSASPVRMFGSNSRNAYPDSHHNFRLRVWSGVSQLEKNPPAALGEMGSQVSVEISRLQGIGLFAEESDSEGHSGGQLL